jgi:drug/metabolite transporter (DMT)-like permease
MAHILIYLLALLALSTSPNWAKLNEMPPAILGFWRLFIAALILFGYLAYNKRLSHLKQHFKLSQNTAWIVLSGFFFFLHLWTYKFASKNTLVSNTMILFATNPIWASIGGVLFFNEKFKLRVLVSYLLAFSALFFFLYHALRFAPDQKWGNWSALASALFYTIYMIAGKKARRFSENIDYSFLLYLVCAICFAIASIFSGASFVGYSDISWIAVAGLVLIPTFLGHLTLTYLVKTMDLSILACGKLIEPILASLLAYFIFRETLMEGAWVAFLMMASSVIILFWPIRKH